eukprot:316280_1
MDIARTSFEEDRYCYAVWNYVYPYVLYTNNNRYFKNEFHQNMYCAVCNLQQKNLVKKKLKVCGGCQLVYYCSKICQKYDWSRNKHRYICNDLTHALN